MADADQLTNVGYFKRLYPSNITIFSWSYIIRARGKVIIFRFSYFLSRNIDFYESRNFELKISTF